MDFMKVLDQTVREIKREVNLKVLKVPEIEQKVRILPFTVYLSVVLDATSDEPWGPHGSALAEIAQATKKFTECQMVMNVLWTRVTDTSANWRYVYKALSVIEYLIAHGSERAVDDIIEHSHRISCLSGFEHVEPNGKDVGINVRKKVETILALLGDKEKIQVVRDKAAATRDKYFGLSSTGITYKSSSASYNGTSPQQSDRYGGISGSRDGESFRDSYRDDEKGHQSNDGSIKSQERFSNEKEEACRMPSRHYDEASKPGSRGLYVHSLGRIGMRPWSPHRAVHGDSRGNSIGGGGCIVQIRDNVFLFIVKTSTRKFLASMQSYIVSWAMNQTVSANPLPKTAAVQSTKPNAQADNNEDDFDDFDPRGLSAAESANKNSTPVDLLGDSLVDDFLDAPTSQLSDAKTWNNDSVAESDLFADADFVSAALHSETNSNTQPNIDLFADKQAFPATAPAYADLFQSTNSNFPLEEKPSNSNPTNVNSFDPFTVSDSVFSSKTTLPAPSDNPTNSSSVDPFASIPMNNVDGSDDFFGAFASNTQSELKEPKNSLDNNNNNSNLNQQSVPASQPAPKDPFQVKSGIWADSLSRGLIDLNITAPKRINLADIGIVGGLSDEPEEKERAPPASAFRGRAMGAGSGLGAAGFFSSSSSGGSGSSTSYGNSQYRSFH
ncbi:Clathrin interactor EPSIN 1 [Apostasia shenzhenica]|uniref:Clathrin interactor EPSIN 1 n=1 Tax=Apostasia shenzhenica TaxID=1088818 RepID=A0A2I0B8V8_9ASPA|nr:Clathrin interactor EPSIN 1 [Apostasia shenzhenica]